MVQHGDQLSSQLRDQLSSQLFGQLSSQLRDQLRDQLSSQLRDQLSGQLFGQLSDQLSGQLSDQLRDQLRDQLSGQLRDQLRDQLFGMIWRCFAGSMWCMWEVLYDFAQEIGVKYTEETQAKLKLWINQATHCHFWYPYDNVVLASERPASINLDIAGRLHSHDRLAIGYSDGWGIHASHGLRVPEYIIERPYEITIEKIYAEQNAEIRRVMIERYGMTRYIHDSGADVVDSRPENFFLKGLRGARLLRKEQVNDEPIVMIAVKNSTPEPDGSIKDYTLRVDPNAYGGLAGTDCLAAIASTWRNEDGSLVFTRPQDYRPEVES